VGFRLRRTVSLLPGLRLNVSNSGVSASIGRRGAWLTIGRRGTRATVGIPGTGLSYTTTSPRTASNEHAQGEPPATRNGLGALGVVLALIAIAAVIGYVFGVAMR
jgi:hypothetical protein